MQGLWQGEENFPFGACFSLIDEFTHFCFMVCLSTRSLPLNCIETAFTTDDIDLPELSLMSSQ